MTINAFTLLRKVNQNKAFLLKDNEINSLQIYFNDQSDNDYNNEEFFYLKTTNYVFLFLSEHIIFII